MAHHKKKQGIETREDMIKAYVGFFKKKKHKEIHSASLLPENDPTVLFTTAGMHPLVVYLLGEKHPLGERIVNVQKCLRTNDIDEVGDEVHGTFFEMLGNWSLGDYWKREAIEFSFEFLTEVLGFEKDKLAVSVFGGEGIEEVDKDLESAGIWEGLGLDAGRIAYLGKADNWWGPAGEVGPCGPDTEIFYWTGGGETPTKFNPRDNRWVEVGNNVFMAYNKTEKEYVELMQKNVDFGGGLVRLLAILKGESDIFKTSVYWPIIEGIEKISGKMYTGNEKEMRVVADHVTSAVLILGDTRGVKPGNLGQGYVLRRLIRRAIRYGRVLGIGEDFIVKVAKLVLPIYPDYQELKRNQKFIFAELNNEEGRFRKVLEAGLKNFEKIVKGGVITGKEAFLLFQSYGFPIEMTTELANEKGVKVDLEEYNAEFKKHQDLSRRVSGGMFKSGLADDSSPVRRLHTATHLLNEALRRVLGEEVKQKGSNITSERLRFDFNFSRKLTAEEIKNVEGLVNMKIEEGLKVIREEVPLKDALESGAQAEFGAKYPELVSVYTIVDSKEEKGWFSKEICTGPHVENTGEVGKFRIVKENSSSAGVRRIKGIVE
jgi:alanyl-tRNA synthetase